MKKLRLAAGWTQAEAARRLGTTQQTYARWESGQAEPSLANLRAIADLFLTSVDGIIGRGALPPPPTTRRAAHDDGSAFWGHLGIRMLGGTDTKWYAVSSDAADRARMALLNAEQEEWIAFPTLTNQLVLVRNDRMAQFCLLDDADEAPFGAFEPETLLDEYAGLPLDAYRMMAAWADGGVEALEEFQCDGADELRTQVRATLIQSEFCRDPVKLGLSLRQSTIHFVDGGKLSYRVLGEHLLDFSYLEGESDRRMLQASKEDGSCEFIYSSGSLQLLELSLIEVEAAREEP